MYVPEYLPLGLKAISSPQVSWYLAPHKKAAYTWVEEKKWHLLVVYMEDHITFLKSWRKKDLHFCV